LREGRAGAGTDVDGEEDGGGFVVWGCGVRRIASQSHVVPEEGAESIVGGECFCCSFEFCEVFGREIEDLARHWGELVCWCYKRGYVCRGGGHENVLRKVGDVGDWKSVAEGCAVIRHSIVIAERS